MLHSKLGASSTYRWMNCPGSVALCEKMPKEKDSPYAAEGTAAHSVGEMALKENKPAVHYVGRTLEGVKVTEEMAEAVQVYVDAVTQTEGIMQVEAQFELDFIKQGMFGTNDASVFNKETGVLHIFDYKHGRGVAVDVIWDPQLMYYALGAAKGIIIEHGTQAVKTVRLWVVQPRAYHEDGEVRYWDIDIHSLNHWAVTVLRPAAEATEDSEAGLFPGEKQCRWCSAKPVCPAVADRAARIAKTEFSKPVLPSPELMTPEELGKVVKVSEEFGSWAASVKAYAQQQAESGANIPGYKLVRKRAYRKWIDEDEAKKQLHATFGEAIYAERKMLSIAQMEKQIKKISGGKVDLSHLVEKPEGEVILVEESDKREPVHAQSAVEFLDSMDVFS